MPRVIPDERLVIEETLRELADVEGCCLIVTTGGTGPALRDVTPEATLAVCEKDDAGIWRADAEGVAGESADGDPLAADGGDSREVADRQPAGPAEGDRRNASTP